MNEPTFTLSVVHIGSETAIAFPALTTEKLTSLVSELEMDKVSVYRVVREQ